MPSVGASWAVLCLTEAAERVSPEEVTADLQRHVPGCTVHWPDFPAHDNPWAGYTFLKLDRPDHQILRVRSSRFVEKILCQPRTRVIERLTDKQLRATLWRPAKLAAGQEVSVVSGTFQGLVARVVRVEDDAVTLQLDLWSGAREITVSRDEVGPA